MNDAVCSIDSGVQGSNWLGQRQLLQISRSVMSDQLEPALRQEKPDLALFQPEGPAFANLGDHFKTLLLPIVAILLSDYSCVNVIKSHLAAGSGTAMDEIQCFVYGLGREVHGNTFPQE